MRDARTGTGPNVIHRHVAKGNPSWDTSSFDRDATTSRAFGPHTPSVHHADEASCTCTEPSPGMWSTSHFLSICPVYPPVTTRKESEPSRMIVRSARTPPASFSHEV